jgi:DNA-binding NarL/FixJ family response regulator
VGESQRWTAVVVDRSELVRRGISAVLEEVGVSTSAATARAGDGLRSSSSTDVQLLVIGRCGDLKHEVALKMAKTKSPQLRVMLLLEKVEQKDVSRLVSQGADALILRLTTEAELTDAVRRLFKGERYISAAVAAGTIGNVGPNINDDEASASSRSGLSKKELEVLAELATGATYKEIANDLIVTQATVKTHLVHIYAKLGVRNRQEAVARGLALGLLS